MSTVKTALITGASSRLGRYLVDLLLQEGYVVYAGFHTARAGRLFESKEIIEVNLDVTSESSTAHVFTQIKKKHGHLDVLINNAALSRAGSFDEMGVADYERLIQVNQVGPLRMIKAALPLMATHGRIINITSLNGVLALPKYAFYVSTKFALLGLTRSLYYELDRRVSITSLAPGAITFPTDDPAKKVHGGARDKMPILNILFPFTKPQDVCRAVVRILNAKNPPSQVFVGADSRLVSMLIKLLPGFILDRAILFVWHRK